MENTAAKITCKCDPNGNTYRFRNLQITPSRHRPNCTLAFFKQWRNHNARTSDSFRLPSALRATSRQQFVYCIYSLSAKPYVPPHLSI
jgi:hypothetical protein